MPEPSAANAHLTVLVLGGTAEGTELARLLARETGVRVISSLAGRTADPRLPPGEVRFGGFGGAGGLAAYLREQQVAAVVDATHPFAATMGWNAAVAGQQTGVPVLRLQRAPWQPGPGDRWIEVADWQQAVEVVAAQARRVLLAIGRQEIAPFAVVGDVWFLIRTVEMPAALPPFRNAEIVLARGPFAEADERALFQDRRIDTIVCKNSGGAGAAAKLAAARALGLTVVMRRRPPRADLPTVASVAEAVAWLRTLHAG